MSITVLLQTADIITFRVDGHLYRYLPKKNLYFTMYRKAWCIVDEDDIGVIEYILHRQQMNGS